MAKRTTTRQTTSRTSRPIASATTSPTKAAKRSRSGSQPKARPRAKATSTGKGSSAGRASEAKAMFTEGIGRAAQGFLFDAIGLFRASIKAAPTSDFADDALFDIGHCYLRMNLLNDAESSFTELLRKYPDAKIHCVFGGREQGRTAAKALLGRARARMQLGNLDGAKADVKALEEYTDSTVADTTGQRRTFHDLGVALVYGS